MNDNLCKIWFAGEEPVADESGGHAAESPAAADFGLDVRHFSVHEQMSGLWQVTLTANSRNPQIPLEQLVGVGAAFVMERPNRGFAAGGLTHRVWPGICTNATQTTKVVAGVSEYVITVRPELWRLTLRKNSRVFQHSSIPEIVLKVLEDWGFTVDTEESSSTEAWKAGSIKLLHFDPNEPAQYPHFPKFEYRVQYEESDYAFISRLLEEAGISHYFNYRNVVDGRGREAARLVLDFHPEKTDERAGGPLHYHGTSSDPALSKLFDLAQNATFSRNVRPGAVTLREHDFRMDVQTARVGRGRGEVPEIEQRYEQFDYTSGALHIEKKRNDRVRGFDEPYAQHFATLELGAVRNGVYVASFETNALDVAPGSIVTFGGEYSTEVPHPEMERVLVTATSFSGYAGDGRKDVGERNAWSVHCVGVPAKRPYVPTKSTPRPQIPGIQSAIVVGRPGREIDCDEFGRIRVQFHWDRQHKFGAPVDEKDLVEPMGSCWVRVSSPWAGAGYGFISVPRIGHEVLVQFLDGDPDQPVVIGSVYNPSSSGVPYPLPAHDRRSVWKSKMSPNQTGFNEIYLDDAAGEVHMQAQTTHSRTVGVTESVNIGSQRSTKIGKHETTDIGEDYKLTVGDQNGISIAAAGKKLQLQVGGSIATITLEKDHISICASGTLHLHGDTGVEISSKSGNVQIEGVQVRINDGQKCPADRTTTLAPAGKPSGPGSIGKYIPLNGGGGMPEAIKEIPKDKDVPLIAPPQPTSLDGISELGLAGGENASVLGPTLTAAAGPALGAATSRAQALGSDALKAGIMAAITGAASGGDPMKAIRGAVIGKAGEGVEAVVGAAGVPVVPALAKAATTVALSGGKDLGKKIETAVKGAAINKAASTVADAVVGPTPRATPGPTAGATPGPTPGAPKKPPTSGGNPTG